MADKWADDDGQSDGQGTMAYRWSDIDILITGMTGGVTDGCVNNEWMG